MPPQNVLRQITVILYRLKRQWGQSLLFKRFDSQTNDVETGAIARIYTDFTVRRAIVLPDRIDRSFIYDLTYIAANNNFVGGAYFDRHQRTIIIDAKDVPKTFVVTLSDHVEFDSRRYEILNYTQLEQKKGFLLRIQEIESSDTV